MRCASTHSLIKMKKVLVRGVDQASTYFKMRCHRVRDWGLELQFHTERIVVDRETVNEDVRRFVGWFVVRRLKRADGRE